MIEISQKIESSEENMEEKESLEKLKKEIIQKKNIEKPESSRFSELIRNQRNPITFGNKEKPEISLTFDDGYGSQNIKTILNILEGSGIKATFFILGDCLNKTPELRKQAAEQGHQICCHTYSHIYLSNSGSKTSLTTGLNKNANRGGIRESRVKKILGNNYYNAIKAESGEGFPDSIKSDILLRTEILMREETIKEILGEEYLQQIKANSPFFRFPGGNGANKSENIQVLKDLGYLSIGRSDDFVRGKNRKHLTTNEMENMDISNGDIALFHFKPQDYEYVKAYIKAAENKGKTSLEISKILDTDNSENKIRLDSKNADNVK